MADGNSKATEEGSTTIESWRLNTELARCFTIEEVVERLKIKRDDARADVKLAKLRLERMKALLIKHCAELLSDLERFED